jgi:hypothetical protein
MNGQREFDCVEMKREVQEKVRQKYAGIPEAEALFVYVTVENGPLYQATAAFPTTGATPDGSGLQICRSVRIA